MRNYIMELYVPLAREPHQKTLIFSLSCVFFNIKYLYTANLIMEYRFIIDPHDKPIFYYTLRGHYITNYRISSSLFFAAFTLAHATAGTYTLLL